MITTPTFELWQQGRSIPAILAAFDDTEEKAYQKAMNIASYDLNKSRNHILENVKESERRQQVLEGLDKIIETTKNKPSFFQGLIGVTSLLTSGHAAKEDFYDRVFGGELVGFGYATPRRPEDDPIQVPDDVWEGKIDWSRSAVTGSGLSFVSVRLVNNTNLPPVEPVETTEVGQIDTFSTPYIPAKAGRKSRREEILAAYIALKADGVITKDTPTAILGHEIRSYILKDIPEAERSETGLSDETIRRTIRSSK